MSSIVNWYNENIVARWWRSWAVLVGMLAAAAPYLIDLADAFLQKWDLLSGGLHVSEATKETVRIVLLVVVLPLARAWRQESLQEAAKKQELARQEAQYMAGDPERRDPS